MKFTKPQWIALAKLRLIEALEIGDEQMNAEMDRNMQDWAESLAQGPCDYFAEGYWPKDAVLEELSYSVG